MDERYHLFARICDGGDDEIIKLKKRAMCCELQSCQLRTILWKIFLGALSTPPRVEEWLKEVNEQRATYTELKKKYTSLNLDEEIDPLINNPLSQDENSPWKVFFENEQIQKTIKQDVERTYPEYSFFTQEWVREAMVNILFVYAKCHPDIEYKQGMHELLAPLLWLIDQEKMEKDDRNPLTELMDKNYVEHDAYCLFSKIMLRTGSWFVSKPPKMITRGKETSVFQEESPVLCKCKHIYHEILRSKDPGLYSYITSLNIEPQLFLLRWVRVLFGREFRLDETLDIWDAIFAFDKSFTLIDFVAVAMIIAVREQILSTDYNGVLHILFKYPPRSTPTALVDHALSMAKPKKLNQENYPIHKTHFGPAETMSAPNPRGPGASEYGRLRWLHNNIAERLNVIVNTFQNDLFDESIASQLPESVMLAVAELKQIKDVMCGHLPPEVLPSLENNQSKNLFNEASAKNPSSSPVPPRRLF